MTKYIFGKTMWLTRHGNGTLITQTAQRPLHVRLTLGSICFHKKVIVVITTEGGTIITARYC